MSTRRGKLPTILLTNDDGPPSRESPFLHSFVRALKRASPTPDSWSTSSTPPSSSDGPSPLRVQVVIPSSQRSWIGKAYLIADRIKGQYYYAPTSPSTGGTGGELRTDRRPFDASEEEEWILLDGTPASCTNIGVHSLFPRQIDLVISGPNFGRNTSSSFSLSSGTLGAALDGALGGVPAIALSYGIFDRPIRDDIVAKANEIAVVIVKTLWEHGFGQASDADLYSVNIPLTPSILEHDCKIVWTTEAITRYSRLFAPASSPKPDPPLLSVTDSSNASPDGVPPRAAPFTTPDHPPLDFRFSPDISALVDPNSKVHAEGSDAEVLNRGHVTVTPLKAAFRPADRPTGGPFGEGKVWAWKL